MKLRAIAFATAGVALLVVLCSGCASTPAGKSAATNDAENGAPTVREIVSAAGRGDAESQYKLGAMYYEGQGVPQVYSTAAEWFRKAAKQGHVRAQVSLAQQYLVGKGVPRDNVKAVEWFRVAAEHGDADAQWILGSTYQNGWGVPRSNIQAYAWYNVSAAQGDDDAVAERDALGATLAPSQMREAQELSREYFEKYVAPFR